MKIEEIRALSNEELRHAEDEVARDSFRLRFQHNTGQLSDSASLRKTRKTIARIKTILRQRQLAEDKKR
ncbi:MAG: 50S ribosomal protein L29 [Myxococcales bacterium]|nr:50S ribosomal protein L29 [Myxococcales bacterium]